MACLLLINKVKNQLKRDWKLGLVKTTQLFSILKKAWRGKKHFEIISHSFSSDKHFEYFYLQNWKGLINKKAK